MGGHQTSGSAKAAAVVEVNISFLKISENPINGDQAIYVLDRINKYAQLLLMHRQVHWHVGTGSILVLYGPKTAARILSLPLSYRTVVCTVLSHYVVQSDVSVSRDRAVWQYGNCRVCTLTNI